MSLWMERAFPDARREHVRTSRVCDSSFRGIAMSQVGTEPAFCVSGIWVSLMGYAEVVHSPHVDLGTSAFPAASAFSIPALNAPMKSVKFVRETEVRASFAKLLRSTVWFRIYTKSQGFWKHFVNDLVFASSIFLDSFRFREYFLGTFLASRSAMLRIRHHVVVRSRDKVLGIDFKSTTSRSSQK